MTRLNRKLEQRRRQAVNDATQALAEAFLAAEKLDTLTDLSGHLPQLALLEATSRFALLCTMRAQREGVPHAELEATLSSASDWAGKTVVLENVVKRHVGAAVLAEAEAAAHTNDDTPNTDRAQLDELGRHTSEDTDAVDTE